MLTHGNITWNVINFLSVVDFRSDDVTIAIAPFFRTGGTGVNVLPVLFTGGTVIVPETPDPDEILRLIEQQRVTIGFGNPDLLEALTRSPRWPTADFSSVRFYITGGRTRPGASHPRRTWNEASRSSRGTGSPRPRRSCCSSTRRAPCARSGRPESRHCSSTSGLCDPTAPTVDRTRPGELLVSGPNVMVGYWDRPDATREAIDEDGWLRTGDAARIDDEGYVWIVDRVDDAYEVSGHVVYPGDVERVLASASRSRRRRRRGTRPGLARASSCSPQARR